MSALCASERILECPTLPARAGVGFKDAHFAEIEGATPDVGFFEIHAENFMGAGGPPHARLTRLRQDYSLSIHGVGLSIGGAQALDRAHLGRVKSLIERYEPAMFSEHLAWSTHKTSYLNDLLPLPYNETTLKRVIAHVDEIQETLGRRILLENPATYLSFVSSIISETEFLHEIARRTGCGLLLDVNNAYVCAVNHGFAAEDYIDAFPMRHVEEIHLAGYAEDLDEAGGRLLIDAHCAPVSEAVWALYERALSRRGPVATLIEWDNDIPAWPVLMAEATRAERLLERRRPAGNIIRERSLPASTSPEFDYGEFVRALLDPDLPPPEGVKTMQQGPEPAARFAVYRNNVVAGLIDALAERFPACLRLVGEEFFRAMAQRYVRASLPRTPMLFEYGADFADFICAFEPARDLSFLPDVARLEYAIGRAYHAEDAAPLSLDFLRSVPLERLEAAAASLHPSAQIIASDHPIVSIWRANMEPDPPRVVDLDRAEDAFVVRPRLDVEVRALSPGDSAFIEILMGGGTFGEAANAASRCANDFDIATCLHTLLACDAFTAINI